MKKNYFIFLFLFSLIVSRACIAQTIDIPDAVLKQKLVTHTNPVIDSNGDGEIQVSEAVVVENLYLPGGTVENQIQDITGLEEFVNTNHLNLQGNSISEGDLSMLTNLATLNLNDNNITNTLSFTFPDSIENLYLGYNNLTNLDISSLNEVNFLGVYNNNLTTLDEEDLPQNIQHLNAINNNILSVELVNLDSLKTLILTTNQIASIQASSLPLSIEELDLQNNNFTSDNDIELSNLNNLKKINLKNNNLESFSEQNLPSSLEIINLSNNSLTYFSGSNFPNLKELNLSDNQIIEIDSNWLSLENLSIGNNLLESFDDSGFNNLKSLTLTGNNLVSLDVSEITQLEKLYVSNCNLESLITGNLLLLYTLYISNNNLSEIDLSQFPGLVFIGMGGNPFTELDFSNNPLLGGDFSIVNLPDLEYVNLKNGNTPDVGFIQDCPNLEVICVDEVEPYLYLLDEDSWWSEYEGVFITNCDFPNTLTGVVKLDTGLGCFDDSSINLPGIVIKANQASGSSASLTNEEGEYTLYVGEGEYTLEGIYDLDYYTISPDIEGIYFNGVDETQEVDFCLEPTETVTDLNVTLLPITQARPGFQTNYELVIKNRGTQTVNQATVNFSFNETSQSFISASETVTSQNTNQISFVLNNLPPFGTQTIHLYMQTFEPPTVNGGDELNFTTTLTPIENDYTPEDNTFDLSQIVVNSFDPNDKRVLQGDEITIEEADEYLDYIIRFQNTGTASAINVRIEDNLNSKLDWSTFQILSSSADFRVEITDETHVEFIFDEINLPYEGEDEEGSQGYIAYKIKPKADVEIGDVISGDASIYFDFNEPIITNTVSTEIVENLNVENYDLNDNITVYPNPTQDLLKVKVSTSLKVEQADIFNFQGQKLLSLRKNLKSINLENLSSGIYILQLKTNKGNLNLQLIKE